MVISAPKYQSQVQILGVAKKDSMYKYFNIWWYKYLFKKWEKGFFWSTFYCRLRNHPYQFSAYPSSWIGLAEPIYCCGNCGDLLE